MSTVAWLFILIGVFLIRATLKGRVLDQNGNFVLLQYATDMITALITNDKAKLAALDSGAPGAGIEVPSPSILKDYGAGPGIDPVDVRSWDKLNPRTPAQAVSWAESQSLWQTGMCERMVTVAYGHSSGFPSARAHWEGAGERHPGTATVPPAGALVFWQTKNANGHVALSAGGGRIVSTDFDGRGFAPGVMSAGPIEAIDKWGPRLGWTPPVFTRGKGSGRGVN